MARREGGAQRTGPHPLTRAPTHAHNPRDRLANPQPPRARRRTARPVPGSREGVGGHARAAGLRAAGGSEAGTARPPAPAGRPRRSGSEREADRGARPGDSRARAAAAPTHPSGGSRAGARPRAPPAGAGAGVAHRHSTARGKATKAGRHARPARDGGPGPGTRAPGRAPPPDPGEGRATGQAEADLQRTHRTDTCPGRTTGPRSGAHTRRTGQHHAGRGRASPDDANNARDRRLGDRAAAGPGSEAHHGGGRASTGCGRAGREKTRQRARQAAKGGGAPREPLQRGQPPPGHAHGGLTASSLRARRRPRVAPGAPDRPSAIPAAPPPPPQSHAARAPGTRPPPHAPQGRPKRSGRPPGPHAGRRRPGPEGTRHGDADAGPSSGRRRRPHKAEPGSGPDGAANSVKAGEPLGEVRIDRRRAGERGTRQARSQGARGTRARGTRREGCSGKKPQARPGHQENTATGSHRHRHEGGPAAPRLGRRTALRQPTEQPLTSPGSRHQGPRSNLSHKPNTRGHTSLVSRLPPTRSRSGRPAPTRQGRSRSQGPGGPTPAPRERGRRHRSRLGTGAGGEPARSGTLRAPAARGSLPAARTSGPARRDPPPTRKGKARATVGDEPRARPPPRGPAEPSLSLPQPRRGVKRRRRRAPCKRVATAALPETQRERERRQAGGSGTPRHNLSDR